jgi:hypothetical protein
MAGSGEWGRLLLLLLLFLLLRLFLWRRGIYIYTLVVYIQYGRGGLVVSMHTRLE